MFIARSRIDETAASPTSMQDTAFLFRDLDLQHATPDGAALLSSAPGETDWHALRAALNLRFPDLPDEDKLRLIDETVIQSADPGDTGVIHLEREEEMVRVNITDNTPAGAQSVHAIRALQVENGVLRLAADAAPYPIWMIEKDGSIGWRNANYDALVESQHLETEHAPLFDTSSLNRTDGGSARMSIKSRSESRETWYDVTLTRSDRGTICHAVDINAVIQAEVAQRNFVQTLAKTFAQLSIGLAIFDRNGQLALFNPALLDLTSLPVEFLSGRPALVTFFDRLRENRVMPEPKNYISWRQEIADLISAATHSTYQETWTLDTGHTYRISGRPHPGGAVAFLIEDITAEISMTRNFRAELELGQSMMDAFDDAIVVFSSAGVLTFCNAAYRDLWKLDPDNSFADVTIVDSIKEWQAQSTPHPDWSDMRDFVMKIADRAIWDTTVQHVNGTRMKVTLTPIVSGATMIRFAAVREAAVTALDPTE